MRNPNVRMSSLSKTFKKALGIGLMLWLGIAPALPKDKLTAIPPGNWSLVKSLPEKTSILVRMTSGDRIDGGFIALDSESIRLSMDKQELAYPLNNVAEVWQLDIADSRTNGTLIGMAIGAGGGAVAASALGQLASNEGQSPYGLGVLALLVGAGVGALIGIAVDNGIKGKRLIYQK